MAVHCKITNENSCYIFKKSGALVPAYEETIKKHTVTTEKYVQVGDSTKDVNPVPDKDFQAPNEFDKAKKAICSRNSQPISAPKPASSTAEYISHRSKYHAEISMFSLEPILNVPHINLDGGLMACWSDVKETLFPGCSGIGCKIVLRSLEIKLKYPLLTKDIRNCSATARLRFINSFHCVEQGETIVNLRFVKRHWESLVEMVAEKHRASTDATSADCSCKAANNRGGSKSLNILCDVECSVGSHCYHSTDCSVEVLSMQSGDKIVHPLPGFVVRNQWGQKEIYVPLVTLLSTYRDLSSWLRAFLRQLAEKCVRIPSSQRWQNKALIVFCSERQGQIMSHLMNEHGCSGPHITSRTMLVKWSYLTKSYFAGNLLTQCLQLTHNYSKNSSRSSSSKSNHSFGRDLGSSESKEEESTWPLRPIQNYQEQLWNYQKIKHQSCKQVTYRAISREKFQAEDLLPKSEKEKQTLRKKWLYSLGKYGDEEVIPLRGTGPERSLICNRSKNLLTERRKSKVYRHDSEKENDATMQAVINPRIHHSGLEKANFKGLTSEMRYQRFKEKDLSFRPCYKDGDKAHNTLETSYPSSIEIQNVHPNSSGLLDDTAGESQRDTSENTEKADCNKTLDRRAGKISNESSNRQRKASHLKEEEEDRREHNTDCSPSEQAQKDEVYSSKNRISFGGEEGGNSLDAEQETSVRVLECNNVINNETKNAGSRQSSQADTKEVKLIQQLKPSENTNKGRMNMNNIKDEGDYENKESSVDLVNSYAVITTHNNNSNVNDDYFNINNNADEYPDSSNKDITDPNDNSTSKTSSAKDISTNSQKSKNKNWENSHVNEQKDGVGRDDKKKKKNKQKANRFEPVPTATPCSVFQSRNSDSLSKTKKVPSLERSKTTLAKRDTLRISYTPKDVSTTPERPSDGQTDLNQGNTTQEKCNLKADPKPDQPCVGGNSESEIGDEDVVITAQFVATQHGCKENPHSFENVASKSAEAEPVKLQPLKKNILMRESIRKDVESSEETRKLDCKCQDLYTPSESFPRQKQFKKKFKVYHSNCLNHLISPEQVKRDKNSNQAHAFATHAETNVTTSHQKSMSPLLLTGVPTLSPPTLTPAGNRTSPRHPKKTLLDNFRREAKEALKVDQIPPRCQALQTAVRQRETLVEIGDSRQDIPSSEVPNERLNIELEARETNRQMVAPLTASSSQSKIDESVKKPQSSDDGVWDSNDRLENDLSSNLSLFYDQGNPTQQYSVHHESESEFPFAFRLECIYDNESQRVGYIHRRFPAISVPYIMIGSVEFITVRSALKLFSKFDENCFVKCFLRDDKQAVCRTTCSQTQASLLRRINCLPDLQPTEGEDLVQIGPLMYNFHRFKEAMRRLRTHNKQTARSQFHYSKDQ